MGNLIVLTFDNVDDAGRVLASIKALERQGQADIEDAAVLVKDASGKMAVKGQTSHASATGAVIGGTLGLLVAFMFPLAGIAIGVAGGALVGHSLGDHVDKKFVKDIEAALQPGTSALFVLGRGNPAAIRAALQPYKGTVYQTSLDSELEAELRRALE